MVGNESETGRVWEEMEVKTVRMGGEWCNFVPMNDTRTSTVADTSLTSVMLPMLH